MADTMAAFRRPTAAADSVLVGRYEFFEAIAQGGMGAVYYGRMHCAGGFRRSVAIKRLRPDLVNSSELRDRFLDEIRLATFVRHPNVVPIVEPVDNNGDLFIVMEYVSGDTLFNVLGAAAAASRQVPIPIVARIALDTLYGLDAAHKAKDDYGKPLDVIHRDVSPQNILVGTDGVTRVFDFGIARARGQHHVTKKGFIGGKPAYMAPEYLRGAQLDHRADLYSASVVIWEALTGRRLFRQQTDDDDIQILTRVLEGDTALPSLYRAEVPEGLDRLIMRGLSHDVSARFSSCVQMAEQLENCLPRVATQHAVSNWLRALLGSSLEKKDLRLRDIVSAPIPMEFLQTEQRRFLHPTSSPTTIILGAASPTAASLPSRRTDLLEVRPILPARGSDDRWDRTRILDTGAPPSRPGTAGASYARAQQTTERLDPTHLAAVAAVAAPRELTFAPRAETPIAAAPSRTARTQELLPPRYETSISVIGASAARRRETLHIFVGVVVMAASALLLGAFLFAGRAEPAPTTVVVARSTGMSDSELSDSTVSQERTAAADASTVPRAAAIDIANLPEVQPTPSAAVDPGPAPVEVSAPPARTPTSLVAPRTVASTSAESAQSSKLFDDAGVSNCIRRVGTRAKSCGADEDVGVVVTVTLTYRPGAGAPSVAILPSKLQGASKECIRQVFKTCATQPFDDRPLERKVANLSLQ